MNCIRFHGYQCPGDGCRDIESCAIREIVTGDAPPPYVPPPGGLPPAIVAGLKMVAAVVGFVFGLTRLAARTVTNGLLSLPPFAAGVIIIVVSFTLATILPLWLFLLYAGWATAIAVQLYREHNED